MKIRRAILEDIPEMVGLMNQLGYPTTIENFSQRFQMIDSHPSYLTLVAEYNGRVAGMVGLSTGLLYEYDGSYVRIVAFVVDSSYRQKGIGKRLMQEVESWATANGAIGIGVNSGNRAERLSAHEFYKSMGFVEKSIGFAKSFV